MSTFQDPYVKATVVENGETAQTKSVEGGGVTPTWEQEHECNLAFKLTEEDTSKPINLRIEIWNENNMVDDLIGSAEIGLSETHLKSKGVYQNHMPT